MLAAHSRPAQRAAPYTRCEACGACSQYQRCLLEPGRPLAPAPYSAQQHGCKSANHIRHFV